MSISTLERKILNCIQEDIPLTSKPFKIVSEKIGIEESRLLKMIKHLKEKGIIRSFSVCLDHNKLGFESSLIALKVPESKIESIAKKLIKYSEITHCYLREGEYNLWMVFISLKKHRGLSQFITRLTRQMGKKNILNLATKRQFKLKTRLKI